LAKVYENHLGAGAGAGKSGLWDKEIYFRDLETLVHFNTCKRKVCFAARNLIFAPLFNFYFFTVGFSLLQKSQ
jgi:hypothetical protein